MNASELMIDMIMIATTKEKMVVVTRICPMMTVTRDDFPLYLTLTDAASCGELHFRRISTLNLSTTNDNASDQEQYLDECE